MTPGDLARLTLAQWPETTADALAQWCDTADEVTRMALWFEQVAATLHVYARSPDEGEVQS